MHRNFLNFVRFFAIFVFEILQIHQKYLRIDKKNNLWKNCDFLLEKNEFEVLSTEQDEPAVIDLRTSA